MKLERPAIGDRPSDTGHRLVRGIATLLGLHHVEVAKGAHVTSLTEARAEFVSWAVLLFLLPDLGLLVGALLLLLTRTGQAKIHHTAPNLLLHVLCSLGHLFLQE